MDSAISSWKQALELYFILLLRRKAAAALYVRRYAVLKFLNEKNSDVDSGECQERYIGAMIESYYYNGLSNSDLGKVLVELTSDEGVCVDDYYRRIADNKVLIMGPVSESCPDVQCLVDKADLCLLPNFLSGYEGVLFGSSYVVSYYNRYHAKRLFMLPQLRKSMKAFYHVFRSNDYFYQRKLMRCGRASIINNKRFVFSGEMMAIQTIVSDVLRFNPSEVKIIGTSFFLSKKSYPSHYTTPKDNLFYDVARHDPISNFIYVKFLYDVGLVNADKATSNCLELSLLDYLEQLINDLG